MVSSLNYHCNRHHAQTKFLQYSKNSDTGLSDVFKSNIGRLNADLE